MTMKMLKILTLIVCMGVACGCVPLIFAGAGAGAGAATYAYISGQLEVQYPRAYETVWNATLDALQDRNIQIEEQRKDGFTGTIKARRASGTGVTIKVENKATNVTLVKIRVGTFGDEEASMLIKKSIDERLGLG
jgi:hypothetical protein